MTYSRHIYAYIIKSKQMPQEGDSMSNPGSRSKDGFFKDVYAVVSRIPAGKVATYGQIAFLIGRPGAARTVGYAMNGAPAGLSCHRVVNRLGEMAPGDIFGGAEAQRERLESEGVIFLSDGRIDLKKCLYDFNYKEE